MDMNLGKLQKTVKDREAWRAEVCGSQSQTRRGNWTTILFTIFMILYKLLNHLYVNVFIYIQHRDDKSFPQSLCEN